MQRLALLNLHILTVFDQTDRPEQHRQNHRAGRPALALFALGAPQLDLGVCPPSDNPAADSTRLRPSPSSPTSPPWSLRQKPSPPPWQRRHPQPSRHPSASAPPDHLQTRRQILKSCANARFTSVPSRGVHLALSICPVRSRSGCGSSYRNRHCLPEAPQARSRLRAGSLGLELCLFRARRRESDGKIYGKKNGDGSLHGWGPDFRSL